MPIYNVECPGCGVLFTTTDGRRKYHSRDCRDRTVAERKGIRSRAVGMPARNVGALNELLVAADLLERGYSVFRSVSQHADCDLVILSNDGTMKRVEVPAAYRKKGGGLSRNKKDNGKYDILAAVAGGRVHYEGLESA